MLGVLFNCVFLFLPIIAVVVTRYPWYVASFCSPNTSDINKFESSFIMYIYDYNMNTVYIIWVSLE